MAIFNFEIKKTSRMKKQQGNSVAQKGQDKQTGKSAVASAAYRSGENLHDDRRDKNFNYGNRNDVYHSEIMTPKGLEQVDWINNREQLWNMVEKSETRNVVVLYREMIGSLQREIPIKQSVKMVKEYVEKHFTSRGMIADVNIHVDKDNHNPHVHIMLTTRKVREDKSGFESKKERDWDKNYMNDWREDWQDMNNKLLKQHGAKKLISCQKNGKHKTQDLPRSIVEMEKRGIETRLYDKIINSRFVTKLKNKYFASLQADNISGKHQSYGWAKLSQRFKKLGRDISSHFTNIIPSYKQAVIEKYHNPKETNKNKSIEI